MAFRVAPAWSPARRSPGFEEEYSRECLKQRIDPTEAHLKGWRSQRLCLVLNLLTAEDAAALTSTLRRCAPLRLTHLTIRLTEKSAPQMPWHPANCSAATKAARKKKSRHDPACVDRLVASFAKHTTQLQELELSEVPATATLLSLVASLRSNTVLRKLTLSRTKVGGTVFTEIITILSKLYSLRHLNVTNCGLTDRDGEHFSRLIGSHHERRVAADLENTARGRKPKPLDICITRIDASANKLGDKTCTALAKVLHNDEWVQSLHLNLNNITAEGAWYLNSLLKYNQALRLVDLSGNEGVEAVAQGAEDGEADDAGAQAPPEWLVETLDKDKHGRRIEDIVRYFVTFGPGSCVYASHLADLATPSPKSEERLLLQQQPQQQQQQQKRRRQQPSAQQEQPVPQQQQQPRRRVAAKNVAKAESTQESIEAEPALPPPLLEEPPSELMAELQSLLGLKIVSLTATLSMSRLTKRAEHIDRDGGVDGSAALLAVVKDLGKKKDRKKVLFGVLFERYKNELTGRDLPFSRASLMGLLHRLSEEPTAAAKLMQVCNHDSGTLPPLPRRGNTSLFTYIHTQSLKNSPNLVEAEDVHKLLDGVCPRPEHTLNYDTSPHHAHVDLVGSFVHGSPHSAYDATTPAEQQRMVLAQQAQLLGLASAEADSGGAYRRQNGPAEVGSAVLASATPIRDVASPQTQPEGAASMKKIHDKLELLELQRCRDSESVCESLDVCLMPQRGRGQTTSTNHAHAHTRTLSPSDGYLQ